MSKRFGRNQKRAMRATILEQSTELRSADKRISDLKNAQRPMREALEEVARVISPHFIGLPATARQVDVIAYNYRVPARMAMQNYLPMVSNGEMASLVSCAVYELENHRVSGALDKLRNQVHFYLQAGRGECAYSISPDDIHQLGWKRLAEVYTPMIAEAFARLVCDEKGGRKQQATRHTQRQLAYLAYWQALGYHFPRGAVIPESTLTPPDTWALPSRTVLAVTAVMLVVVYGILKVFA